MNRVDSRRVHSEFQLLEIARDGEEARKVAQELRGNTVVEDNHLL